MLQVNRAVQVPAFPYCYKCDGPTTSTCDRCGRVFCRAHGGQRLGYQAASWGLDRRLGVAERTLCDECTPNQTALRIQIAVVVAVALIAGTLVATMMTGLGR